MSISIKLFCVDFRKCMCYALNLYLEFKSKLCLEFFLVQPLIKDNLSTIDKQLVPKVSSLWKFPCNHLLNI